MANAATPKSPRGTGSRKSSSTAAPAPSERRRQIVDISAQLFAERGYKATTVRAIGDAAGVLSGSLYHHFDSKEAIADELFTIYFEGLVARYRDIIDVGADPRETFTSVVRAAFETIGQHRAANIVLQNEGEYLSQFPRFKYLKDREKEIEKLWIGVIKEGIDSGAFRKDLDPKMVYRFVRDGVWAAVRWFTPSGRLKTSDLADQYLGIILDGLSPRSTARRGRSA